jgi:NACHT domain
MLHLTRGKIHLDPMSKGSLVRKGRDIGPELAVSSALAVLAGVGLNTLVFQGDMDWSSGGLVGAGTSIAAGVLSAALLLRHSSKRTLNLKLSEEAAVRRIRTTLVAQADMLDEADPNIALQLSIALRDRSTDADRPYLQTSSVFIAKLASDPRCTVVTGQPGSGKSMLLRHLALRMAAARERNEFRYTPLLLQCREWTNDSKLAGWVSDRTRYVYGIPTPLTKSWMRRGEAILLLDGADEMIDDESRSFIVEVNGWLNSAVGGRVILSCRNDSYVSHFRMIRHDQVANLEPLPNSTIREYLSRLLAQRIADPTQRAAVQSLIFNVALESQNRPSWSTPLLIKMLGDALSDGTKELGDVDAADDPAALAVRIGDTLNEMGDHVAAIESYMAAMGTQSSHWRSLAGLRASLLLAQSGDHEGARSALERSLAAEIEKPLHETLMPIEDHLSDDECSVLRVLSSTKSLDAFQISSRASVPPSRCNAALRQLRDRGLAEVIDNEGAEPRFQRSAVELIER